jgi:hypothetical protein
MHKDFVRGVKCAADIAAQYDSSSTHAYRLDDCILCKLNVIKREKPRKNKHRLTHPGTAWIHGYAVALAEMHRLGGHSSTVCEAARAAGLTLRDAKGAGTDPFDLRELKKAGVE